MSRLPVFVAAVLPWLAASPQFALVTPKSTGDQRAINILRELHAAEEELIGRAVVMTNNGKAGTIEHVFLDDLHGLRISIGGYEGRRPISTVKFI